MPLVWVTGPILRTKPYKMVSWKVNRLPSGVQRLWIARRVAELCLTIIMPYAKKDLIFSMLHCLSAHMGVDQLY